MFRFLTKQRATPLQHASAHALDGAFPLPMPLMQLSPQDVWRLQNACEGTLIMGGSGKTSGSGQVLVMAFLQAGFGGLVLCAKPGERALWEHYARQAGRSESLIVFDDSGARRFNFLDYELKRAERLTTHNLVALFLRILEAARGGGGGQESANERF